MDETYRMLGREREADFGREAASRRLAAEAVRAEKSKPMTEARRAHRAHLRARIASLLLAFAQRRRSEPAT